jgi:NAD(P)-dependent dehydrogenase (short-subunit alcohol dehydrogenase family)
VSALAGRTALVTGASQNLGRAMALALAAAGARVVVHARRNREGAEAVAAEIRRGGGEAVVAVGDVSDPAAVDAIAGAVEGRVDVLVNNAAMRPRQPFLDMSLADWDRVLSVNLLGPILCARRWLPDMVAAGWGRIINISGIDAYEPMTHRAHNIACKAGLLGFTRALAREYGEAGITANALVPGIFDTSRAREDYPMWPLPEEVTREMVPVGRFGRPEELAEACVFLASSASSYVNGQAIHVNGGRVMA